MFDKAGCNESHGHSRRLQGLLPKYYRGVDRHARKIYIRGLSLSGKAVVCRNIKTDTERFLSRFFSCFPFIEEVAAGISRT